MLAIAGHPRSGTTLLTDLCNTHPDLRISREAAAFTGMDRPFREWVEHLDWSGLRTRRLHPDAAAAPRLSNYSLLARITAVTAWHSRGSRVRASHIERGLRAALGPARIVGDKRPSYVFRLRRFRRRNIPVVIVFRDGRDVLASLRTTGGRGVRWAGRMSRQPFRVQVARWVRAIEAMEAAADWAHIIRYESLLASPERCLAGMAEYLGIEPTGFDVSSVQRENSGKWRSVFTDDEIAEIDRLAGATLARLGYR